MSYTREELEMAMEWGCAVEHNGHKYSCISAVITRGRMIVARKMKAPVLQVELMDLRANSVTIAPAEEIKILIK